MSFTTLCKSIRAQLSESLSLSLCELEEREQRKEREKGERVAAAAHLFQLVGPPVVCIDLAVGQSQSPYRQDAVHVISHPTLKKKASKKKSDSNRSKNRKR